MICYQEVLSWITAESSGDHTIEIVTGNMLDQVLGAGLGVINSPQIVAENDHVAVMFYEKGEEKSDK